MAHLTTRGRDGFATIVLVALCSWVLVGDHAIASALGLGSLDLVVRVLLVFAIVSVADRLYERLPKS